MSSPYLAQELQPQEDLSKLKGPSKWWGVLSWLTLLVAIAAIGGILGSHGMRGTLAWWEMLMVVCPVIGFMRSLYLWGMRNSNGRMVRWWKDGGAWRVTAQKYPEAAKGLVIQVNVKASPSFTLRWGSKGWCHTLIGGWLSNLKDERMQFVPDSQATLASEGLTIAVVDFLFSTHNRWRVIPLDAGRVLRFVDRRDCGIEVRYTCLDGVDLEEILRSIDCAHYHKRMQEKARNHDESYRAMYEVYKAVGLSAPIYEETLAERLGKVKDGGVKMCGELESAWAELRLVLNSLNLEMERAGRPKAKVAIARRVELLKKFLHEHLPADHPLRAGSDISQEALDDIARVIREYDAETARRAPEATGSGLQGDEP